MEIELKRRAPVAVFGGVGAVVAAVLVDVRVRLHVRVEHRLVDARVAALGALERFRAEVVAHVVLEVVLVLCHKRTLGARQQLLGLDVDARMPPEVELGHGHEAEGGCGELLHRRQVRARHRRRRCERRALLR